MTIWQGRIGFYTDGFDIDRAKAGNYSTATRSLVLPLETQDRIEPEKSHPVGAHWSLHVLNPVMLPKVWQSIVGPNHGDDFIYERIWFSPNSIAAGFITEEVDTDVSIWNAYQYRVVQITAVTVQNAAGTAFDIENVPINMAPTNERGYVITILKDGPPIQDTYYRITIDGEIFQIYITGIRVIGITQPVNIGDEFNLEFEFKVAMFQTEEFTEQRTPMYIGSWIKCSATFQLDTLAKHKLYNRFVYGKDKVFGMPIFTEPIVPTSVTLNDSFIGTSTDTTYLWNLRNKVGFVIIVDHENDVAEMKATTTIDQYQINLEKPILETFTLNRTIVYPVFFGYLEGLNLTDDAAKFGTFKATIKEFKSGR